MIIMNCCDYCWEPQTAADLRFPFAASCFPQAHFATPLAFPSDYVYNPKEARIRKAMRDQANKARTFHQQNQRQQQQHFHQISHQPHNRHSSPLEARNEIRNQGRMGLLAEQTASSNIQQKRKISHMLIPPHILQHKPYHIQMQQVNHGMFSDGCNQQWMIGLNHKTAPQYSQHDLSHIQEQDLQKRKASIREQVQHGMVDSGFEFVDADKIPYSNARVIEVTGTDVGMNERNNSENRGIISSQVNKGQEIAVFTDLDGRQHWYPCAQTDEVKGFNSSTENGWSEHQEQGNQIQQNHLQHENFSMKLPGEQQQLFPLQCSAETESSSPQGKVEQTAHYNYQRIITIPPNEMNCNEEESFNAQQYIICSPTTPHPQVRFSIQPHSESSTFNNVWQSHERPVHPCKEEKEDGQGQYLRGHQIEQVEVSKEKTYYREAFETSSTDSISPTIKIKNNIGVPIHEEIGQRNPNLLPLPAFQQAFGSTEIGRFANEGFLSQSPVAPSWSDPSSPHGLPSPSSAFKSAAAYYYPIGEEVTTTHPISFPHSLSSYFDCSLHEDIDGPGSEYGDLLGLGEGPGFDFLPLHMPQIDSHDQDGDSFSSTTDTNQDNKDTHL